MTEHTQDQGLMGQGSTGSAQCVVTAMFDDHDSANRAVENLISAGFPRSRVGLVRNEQGSDASRYADGREDKGFWASMADLFSGSDQQTYSEGLRRGGYLVSAEVAGGEEENRASDILNAAGAIDIDERASSWRESGWQGGSGYPSSGSEIGSTESNAHMESIQGGDLRAPGDAERVIPVAEEQLHVGKRETVGGRVRVHTRQLERPVEEQVTLREERVEVQRRPATGAAPVGADPFEERTVEVQAMKEEPVVAKEARVVEEVVVGKKAEEHTETVRDTVRKTEVDVEEDASDRGSEVPRKPM